MEKQLSPAPHPRPPLPLSVSRFLSLKGVKKMCLGEDLKKFFVKVLCIKIHKRFEIKIDALACGCENSGG